MDLFQELYQMGPEKSATRYRTEDSNHDRAIKEVSEIMSLDGDDSSILSEPDTSVMIPPSFDQEDLPLMNMIQPTLPQESLPDREMIEVNSKRQQSSTTIQLDSPIGSTVQQKPSSGTSLPGMSMFNSNQVDQGRPAVNNPSRIASTLSQEIKPDQLGRTTPSQKRPTQSKRKRRDSDVIRVEDDSSESEEEFSRASSPEYNPASTLTRSGRQSVKADPIYTPAPTPTRIQPIGKKPHPNQYTVKKHPKIKAKVYRGREAFALCEHCTRQFGPPDNVIVFCDACNKCWHQRCHEPRIPKETVNDSKAEWFCSDCDRILHGKKKKPTSDAPTSSQSTATAPIVQTPVPLPVPRVIIPHYSLPLVPGMSMTLAQRKIYLNSLSKEKLMEIVLHASNLAPNMPIFETPMHLVTQMHPQGFPIFLDPPPQFQQQIMQQPTASHSGTTQHTPTHQAQAGPQIHHPATSIQHGQSRQSQTSPLHPPGHKQQHQSIPQPQRSSMPPPPIPTPSDDSRPIYNHPTAHITSKPNTNPPAPNTDTDDEGYFDDFDEMALIYPKAGTGAYDMALPPEPTDYEILLEGPETKTFSHWTKGKGEVKTELDTKTRSWK